VQGPGKTEILAKGAARILQAAILYWAYKIKMARTVNGEVSNDEFGPQLSASTKRWSVFCGVA
jgi:hypothetical protein